MQLDAAIDRITVRERCAIQKDRNQRKRDIVGIQITELRELVIRGSSPIPACANGEAVVLGPPRHQSGEAVAILFIRSMCNHAVACTGGIPIRALKRLRNAEPEREGLGGGVAGRGKSCVARRLERGNITCAQVIE